uniref:Uncharacterized protein n=2 Tax=Meloidogyne TaxID=189290 RepID=A0A6V7TSP5_MELEN|nr:unnamed protein product [Meloidogyne enterolobii]
MELAVHALLTGQKMKKKAKIQQLYEDWMMHGERETTSGGKPRPPSMKIYLNWIVEAWKIISEETISKSFKLCGVTNAIDGTEDDEINCFKPDGPVPEGRALLKKARDDKELVRLFEEIDLAEDKENGIASDDSIEL